MAGKVRINGELLVGVMATAALTQLVTGMKPLFDKEVCTTYEETPEGLIAKVTFAIRART